MEVTPTSSTVPTSQILTNNDPNSTSESESSTRKIDPNSESELIDAFLPGMITNQLMLNNNLFNFAKEAIDEADG